MGGLDNYGRLAYHLPKPSERLSDQLAGDTVRASALVAALRRIGVLVDIHEAGSSRSARLAVKGYQASVKRFLPRRLFLPVREVVRVALSVRQGKQLGDDLSLIRPDAILETHNCLSMSGLRASSRTGIPLIVDDVAPPCEAEDIGGVGIPSIHRRVFDAISRQSMLMIAVNDTLAQCLLDQGVPREKIAIVENGTDLHRFKPAADRALERRRLGIAAGAPVLGFVGSFQGYHQVDKLIAAFGRLASNDATLLMIGDGPNKAECESMVRQAELSDRVRFFGRLPNDEVPTVLAAADIAVLPATTDYGNPMKLYDYLAMGAAIVAPDKPPVRDVVTHMHNALLFAPDEPQSLVAALNAMTGDSELRRRLSANALAQRPHIGWDARARTLLSAIATALARNTPAIAGRDLAANAGTAIPPQPAVANWNR